jgi:hypothetical protein
MEIVVLDQLEILPILLHLQRIDGIKTQRNKSANPMQEEFPIWRNIIQMEWEPYLLEVHSKYNGWLVITLSITKIPEL